MCEKSISQSTAAEPTLGVEQTSRLGSHGHGRLVTLHVTLTTRTPPLRRQVRSLAGHCTELAALARGKAILP